MRQLDEVVGCIYQALGGEAAGWQVMAKPETDTMFSIQAKLLSKQIGVSKFYTYQELELFNGDTQLLVDLFVLEALRTKELVEKQ